MRNKKSRQLPLRLEPRSCDDELTTNKSIKEECHNNANLLSLTDKLIKNAQKEKERIFEKIISRTEHLLD